MDEKINENSLQMLKKAFLVIEKMGKMFKGLQNLEGELDDILVPGELKEAINGKKIRVPIGIRDPIQSMSEPASLKTIYHYYVHKRKKWIRKVLRKHFEDTHDPLDFTDTHEPLFQF
ncbi:MAG: hypothetical protein ACFFCS_09415 [Candidatus Hodarchaeota archaeon]